ncbi:MAG: ATP-dependent Clp protease adaptor ClpS [Ignavibacteria bacterium]|nr:ATP-dependent Clp protease adaptor ClpS [Ignavibacteria bacterium]
MSTKEKGSVTADIESTDKRKLILFNSEHFWDQVISQLQKATGFDIIQCEQIAIIAHTKGKAVVKSGEYAELSAINSVLQEIHLITEIK